VRFVDKSLIQQLLAQARQNPRRRVNYNFHRTPEEDPNRFLNVMLEGTYVAPHRHAVVPKPEMFVVLEGRIAVFTFNGEGAVEACGVAGEGAPEGRVAVDIPAGVWHTLAVLTPHAVLVEVKPGFYDPATDKQFAPWAPGEGEQGAEDYLKELIGIASIAGR
jgi:cupin fold WbuC family metalloprotein